MEQLLKDLDENEKAKKIRLQPGVTMVRLAENNDASEIEYVQMPIKKGQWLGDDGLPESLCKMISDAVDSYYVSLN